MTTFDFRLHTLAAHAADPAERWRYRALYRWILPLAVLDVCLTSMILTFGGTEHNWLACWLFRESGPVGLALLKAACLLLTVAICEAVGQRREKVGRGVARFALAANSVAVAQGAACLGIIAAAV